MNDRIDRIINEPWMAEVSDIIEIASRKGITLTPRDIKGHRDYTIDGMEWYEWLDAMTENSSDTTTTQEVRYIELFGHHNGIEILLSTDDPRATAGITTQADGWTYHEYEVSDRKGSPYVVVSFHHDRTGRVLGAYWWSEARTAGPDEFPAIRNVLKFN